jgi:hypothetical protein
MMYIGRNEFGKEHAQYVTYGIGALVVGIFISWCP